MSTADKLANLQRLREEAQPRRRRASGIAQQHERGKLTARERLDLLLDEGTLRGARRASSRTAPPTSGWTTSATSATASSPGYGRIDGRLVYVFSQDFTVFGGSLSEAHAEKICKVMDLAMKNGAPIIGLNDSGGARIQEGVVSLGGYADIFLRNTLASGVVPQISVVMGPCAGGAVYSPAITDFIVMVEGTQLHVRHRPERREDGDARGDRLRGARRRARRTTRRAASRTSSRRASRRRMELARRICSATCRRTTSTTPPTSHDWTTTRASTARTLDALVPDSAEAVLRHATTSSAGSSTRDCSSRSTPHFARNIICGFARLEGRSVGIVAQQPAVLAGVLDIDASVKAARFVRFCDCFNIPLVTFVDVPGFLPGRRPGASAASSATARSCCTPTARRRCRSSPSSRARRTAARTTS